MAHVVEEVNAQPAHIQIERAGRLRGVDDQQRVVRVRELGQGREIVPEAGLRTDMAHADGNGMVVHGAGQIVQVDDVLTRADLAQLDVVAGVQQPRVNAAGVGVFVDHHVACGWWPEHLHDQVGAARGVVDDGNLVRVSTDQCRETFARKLPLDFVVGIWRGGVVHPRLGPPVVCLAHGRCRWGQATREQVRALARNWETLSGLFRRHVIHRV